LIIWFIFTVFVCSFYVFEPFVVLKLGSIFCSDTSVELMYNYIHADFDYSLKSLYYVIFYPLFKSHLRISSLSILQVFDYCLLFYYVRAKYFIDWAFLPWLFFYFLCSSNFLWILLIILSLSSSNQYSSIYFIHKIMFISLSYIFRLY
jgi:hypothetical protein